MPFPILAGKAITATGFSVDNSCVFEAGYLKKTVTASSATSWTLSFWMKLHSHSASSEGYIWSYGKDGGQGFYIGTSGFLGYYAPSAAGYGSDNALTDGPLRDNGAWYHVVFKCSSGTGTTYLNGVQQSGGTVSNVAPLNATTGDTYAVNSYINYEDSFDDCRCNLAEYCLIDGSALNPTSFGEFDEDSPRIWKPIDVSGLTFGTNGFYLKFEDSSDLGVDSSGNSNDFTATRVAAGDQSLDTPTNNFATLNNLGMPTTNTTFTEGNLNVNVAAGSTYWSVPTIGVSSGKWYVEGKLITATASSGVYYADYGFADRNDSAGESFYVMSGRAFWLSYWDSKINYRTGGSTTAGLQTGKTGLSQGDFFQLYLDMDNELMYWGLNGSVTNSTGISFNGKESLTGEWYFAFGDQYTNGAHNYAVNFGGGSIDGTAVSSYNDANGYGNFKYNPTVTTDEGAKDFLALCTKNLAEHGG